MAAPRATISYSSTFGTFRISICEDAVQVAEVLEAVDVVLLGELLALEDVAARTECRTRNMT